jgi:hypothetical protein
MTKIGFFQHISLIGLTAIAIMNNLCAKAIVVFSQLILLNKI